MSNHVGGVILPGGHLAHSVCGHQLDSPIIVVLHLDQPLVILEFFFHFPYLFLEVGAGLLLLCQLLVDFLVFLRKHTGLCGSVD